MDNSITSRQNLFSTEKNSEIMTNASDKDVHKAEYSEPGFPNWSNLNSLELLIMLRHEDHSRTKRSTRQKT